VYSISVALQALTVISVGGIADYGEIHSFFKNVLNDVNLAPHRKRLLLTFGLLGAISATVFLALSSTSPLWFLSSILAIFANVGFGVSIVAMNAYLPSLARSSPEVAELHSQLEAAVQVSAVDPELDSDYQAEDPLLPGTSPKEPIALRARYDAELSKATSRISSTGIALGYGAGILLLILALIPVTRLKGTTFSLRLAIGLSGIWWAVFSIPAAIWLPGSASAEAESVALDEDSTWIQPSDHLSRGEWNLWKEITAAWKRLGSMLHPTEIRRLKNTFIYLAAWFLLSDGKSSPLVQTQSLFFLISRLHDHHLHCGAVCKDLPEHAAFLAHRRRGAHTMFRHWRVSAMANLAASLGLVKSTGLDWAGHPRFSCPSLWVPGILISRSCQIWRVDNTG
jgi:MFS transporter, UMF1 family